MDAKTTDLPPPDGCSGPCKWFPCCGCGHRSVARAKGKEPLGPKPAAPTWDDVGRAMMMGRAEAAAEIEQLRAAPHYTREEGDELCERLQRVRDLARQMMQFSRYGSAFIQGMQEAGAQIFQLCTETAAASGGRDGER